MVTKAPVLFVSHGSPMIALEEDAYTRALETVGKKMSQPKSIVMMSAHWEAVAPIRVNVVQSPEMIYDFGGFPDELFQIKYPCPGNPELGKKILNLLKNAGIQAVAETRRGIDHGVWVPLRRLFPKADIPLVEISLPVPRTPADIVRIGKTLAPLREENILLLGSGGVVHNLRQLHFADKEAAVDSWAQAFDDWVKKNLTDHDLNSLGDYRAKAPNADRAVPELEHFDPLFFVLGAAPEEPVQFVYEGFHYGNLSMRSFLLGK